MKNHFVDVLPLNQHLFIYFAKGIAKRPVTIYMHQHLENSHRGLNRSHFHVILLKTTTTTEALSFY